MTLARGGTAAMCCGGGGGDVGAGRHCSAQQQQQRRGVSMLASTNKPKPKKLQTDAAGFPVNANAEEKGLKVSCPQDCLRHRNV
jgi:hypothetical protein